MGQLSVILTDLRTLSVDTLRVWWRLLPLLLALQGVSWGLYELTLWVAAWASTHNGWVALVVFSLSLVTTLATIVLMLRLVGRELGLRELIPPTDSPATDDGAEGEHKEHSEHSEPDVARLLAITLLPFLGIYAAFNYVQDRATELTTISLVQTGVTGSTLLGELDPTTSGKATLIVVGIVVGTYLLRRGLDALHERTEWRWLGIVVALVESFFMLTVILSAARLLGLLKSWLLGRTFVGWLAAVEERAAALFALIRINLPAVVDWLGSFIFHTVLPGLIDVAAQPVAWLAVAALVYGTHVLSLAELWRKGRPLTSAIPVPRRLARLRARKQGSTGLRRVALELQEVFLGDIDDKYLPTFQSLRLILRAGVTFLGAYVLLYTAVRLLGDLFSYIVDLLSGGRTVDFWIAYGSLIDLAEQLLTEPLRITLLGVAFYRCLRVFRANAAAPVPVPTVAAPAVSAPLGQAASVAP